MSMKNIGEYECKKMEQGKITKRSIKVGAGYIAVVLPKISV
jgi:hypothetical protein